MKNIDLLEIKNNILSRIADVNKFSKVWTILIILGIITR